MTPFEQHMRCFHPNSTVARLSKENEELRGIITRVSAATYAREAYPISWEDEERMVELVKQWKGKEVDD